jgi:hypothetical protein
MFMPFTAVTDLFSFEFITSSLSDQLSRGELSIVPIMELGCSVPLGQLTMWVKRRCFAGGH